MRKRAQRSKPGGRVIDDVGSVQTGSLGVCSPGFAADLRRIKVVRRRLLKQKQPNLKLISTEGHRHGFYSFTVAPDIVLLGFCLKWPR